MGRFNLIAQCSSAGDNWFTRPKRAGLLSTGVERLRFGPVAARSGQGRAGIECRGGVLAGRVAMMDVTVEIHCGTCGSANYGLPQGADGDAPLLCNDCGRRLGSVAELQAEMLAQALAHCAETLRRDLSTLADGEAA